MTANTGSHFVDIGSYGRDNDTAIVSQSEMYQAFSSNKLGVPTTEASSGTRLPYVLVSDEIFPIKTWLMHPNNVENSTLKVRTILASYIASGLVKKRTIINESWVCRGSSNR